MTNFTKNQKRMQVILIENRNKLGLVSYCGLMRLIHQRKVVTPSQAIDKEVAAELNKGNV